MARLETSEDGGLKLPTRLQLQVEAFGLSTRTPEWMLAGRGCKPASAAVCSPSADTTWVVAATSADGWGLLRVRALFSRHGIKAELDRPAKLIRVPRNSLRAACGLLRAHRPQLRKRRLVRPRGSDKIGFAVMVGLPILLGMSFLVLDSHLLHDSIVPVPWAIACLALTTLIVIVMLGFFTRGRTSIGKVD
jgi:hypothetical protein